tara:strand:- start:51902 stop:52897 length:996 start_codon:yes stop_codon:yes gene_type:complete
VQRQIASTQEPAVSADKPRQPAQSTIDDGSRVYFNPAEQVADSTTHGARTPGAFSPGAAPAGKTDKKVPAKKHTARTGTADTDGLAPDPRDDETAAASQQLQLPAKPPKPHYFGHRQRLRERFLKGGNAALAEYELLELLLCMAIPRGDVKPLAKSLIDRFGNLAGVLTADQTELASCKGIGEAAIATIKIAEASAQVLSRERAMELPVIASWEQLIDYCRVRLGHRKTEELHLLFLDRKNRLIADECHQTGTVDHTPVYPREVIKRALELHASALILVHNHPSGDATPSRGDIDMTRKIIEAAKAMDINVHDHIIISQAGYNSFKTLGLM